MRALLVKIFFRAAWKVEPGIGHRGHRSADLPGSCRPENRLILQRNRARGRTGRAAGQRGCAERGREP